MNTAYDTEKLAREFGPKITSLCRRMVRGEDEARDAAQEVWAEILRSLPGFRGESSVSTWIYTIARRRIQRYIKDEQINSARFLSLYFRNNEQYGMPEMAEIPQEDRNIWVRLNCSDCINAILHCLEGDARLLYLLRALTPLSYGELAAVFEREEAAIRKMFSRASRKISRFLSGNCHLYNPAGDCHCKMKGPLQTELRNEIHKEIRRFSRSLQFIKTMDDFTSLEKNWITVSQKSS